MIRLWSLGDSLIEIGETRIGPDAEVLFATALVLVMERGHRVTRERVIGLLWPDAEDANGRHCLRQALYQLRRFGASIRVQGSALELSPSEVVTDYEALITDGARLDPIDAGRLGGGFLSTYRPRLSPALAEWVDVQRSVVHAAARRVLLRAIADHRGRSDWGRVEMLARACLVVDPLNEEATLALAEAVALAGAKAEAVGILDRYLSELGPAARDLKLPASVLRRRIAERLPQASYGAPRETALFGRGELMATLTAELRQARDGAGRGCLLVGAPGIGKSRLASELGRVATLEGVQLQRTVCHPGDAQRPLSAFVDLVPGLLMLPGAIGCSPTSMAYLRRLTEHDPDAPSLTDDEHDASMRYTHLRRALFDLVDAVASEGSVMLVVESVHWLDPLSWSLFREMVEWAASRRVLFVFTSRPEGTATREPDPAPGLRLLPIPPLDIAGATKLLDALAGSRRDDLSPASREWYLASAEGNPLYLRELVTHWLETGASFTAPTSLMELIQQRVARLSVRARRVLQVCAVLGKSGTFERIERALESGRAELLQAVEELETVGFLTAAGMRVGCRHDLIAEASTATLNDVTKRLLHRAVAAALEKEAEANQSSALAWDCAQQWRLAGDSGQALRLIHSCARQLIELGLVGDATSLLERAELLCTNGDELATLLSTRRNLARLTGDWLLVLELADRLAGNPHLTISGQPADNVLARLEAKWRLHKPLDDLLRQAIDATNARHYRAEDRLRCAKLALFFADGLLDSSAATVVFRQAEPLLPLAEDRSLGLWIELIYHSSYGDLSLAEVVAERLIHEERAHGHTASLVAALRLTTIPLRRLGQFDRAIRQLYEAIDLSDARGYSSAAQACQVYLAITYRETEEIALAMETLVRMHDQTHSDSLTRNTAHIAHIHLLIAQERFADAAALFAGNEVTLLTHPVLRERLDALVAFVHVTLQLGGKLEHSLWSEFISLYERARAHGGQDYSTAVLCDALIQRGELPRAKEYLRVYLSGARRETFALPVSLRRTEELLVDQS